MGAKENTKVFNKYKKMLTDTDCQENINRSLTYIVSTYFANDIDKFMDWFNTRDLHVQFNVAENMKILLKSTKQNEKVFNDPTANTAWLLAINGTARLLCPLDIFTILHRITNPNLTWKKCKNNIQWINLKKPLHFLHIMLY